jgi:hypothetical protein
VLVAVGVENLAFEVFGVEVAGDGFVLGDRVCSLLRATRLAPVGPVFPVVVGGVFAIGSLPSRRSLPHAHNAVYLRRVKASSPNVARLVQKEPSPPVNRWGREGLPWL